MKVKHRTAGQATCSLGLLRPRRCTAVRMTALARSSSLRTDAASSRHTPFTSRQRSSLGRESRNNSPIPPACLAPALRGGTPVRVLFASSLEAAAGATLAAVAERLMNESAAWGQAFEHRGVLLEVGATMMMTR